MDFVYFGIGYAAIHEPDGTAVLVPDSRYVIPRTFVVCHS
jgi:hypothetical protein